MSDNVAAFQIRFYENNNIHPDLLKIDAEIIAGKLVEKNAQGVSRHQLRRLYDEVKKYKLRLDKIRGKDSKEKLDAEWNKVKPLVMMIKSKTAYLVARMMENDNKQYYDNLYQFIDQSLNLVKTYEDFNVFCLLFEAVYGFYYNLGGAQTK